MRESARRRRECGVVFGRGTYGRAEITDVATSACAIEANAGRMDDRAYTNRYASRMPAFLVGRK